MARFSNGCSNGLQHGDEVWCVMRRLSVERGIECWSSLQNDNMEVCWGVAFYGEEKSECLGWIIYTVSSPNMGREAVWYVVVSCNREGWRAWSC